MYSKVSSWYHPPRSERSCPKFCVFPCSWAEICQPTQREQTSRAWNSAWLFEADSSSHWQADTRDCCTSREAQNAAHVQRQESYNSSDGRWSLHCSKQHNLHLHYNAIPAVTATVQSAASPAMSNSDMFCSVWCHACPHVHCILSACIDAFASSLQVAKASVHLDCLYLACIFTELLLCQAMEFTAPVVSYKKAICQWCCTFWHWRLIAELNEIDEPLLNLLKQNADAARAAGQVEPAQFMEKIRDAAQKFLIKKV